MGGLFKAIMSMFGSSGGTSAMNFSGKAMSGWPSATEQATKSGGNGGGLMSMVQNMAVKPADANSGTDADSQLKGMMGQPQNPMYAQMMQQAMQPQQQAQRQPIQPVPLPTVQPVKQSDPAVDSLLQLLLAGRR
jgi:hypothetical protein